MTLQPDNFESTVKFWEKIESIGYQKMINRILRAVNNVVDTIVNRQLNVLVHCSDGWDRTA
jgi:protein tyrosine/serine phosphatase